MKPTTRPTSVRKPGLMPPGRSASIRTIQSGTVPTISAAIPDAMVGAQVNKSVHEITIANTNGVAGSYKKTIFAAGAMGTIVEGDNILQHIRPTVYLRRDDRRVLRRVPSW